MPPHISVIIPAHNEEKYIRPTLHSLKNQTYQDFETIIVANGCTDKTEEITRKRENERVKLIILPVANVSRARNYGASKAEGELLLFLDADTQLAPDALQKMNEQFTEGYAIATTTVKPDEETFPFSLIMTLKSLYLKNGLYKSCSGALLCRRADFDAVNGYDSGLNVMEHRKLIMKLIEKGRYRCIDTSVTTSMRRLKDWGLGKAALFWLTQRVKDKAGHLQESEYEKIR
ncbi:glycosyltransferase [Candidatus Woesearchaeota archaeon]|nr:glycosyltransferase [Candidatus Woesearchaeota archaeon]